MGIEETVEKPWGNYTVLDRGKDYLVKKLVVDPKQKLSVQYHNYRDEHWVVVDGLARITRDKEFFDLETGQTVYIPKRMIHSVENRIGTPLSIIEVQVGLWLSESDIVRVADAYGRK